MATPPVHEWTLLAAAKAVREKAISSRELTRALLDRIDRLDTRDVVPTSHAVEMGTPFRDDVVRPFGGKEAILANAPDREGDFFRVPRIIED